MNIAQLKTDKDLSIAKQIAESAFSTTPDSSLDEWLSFSEMMEEIKKSRGLGLIAYDGDQAMGMVYAQQENPINGKEGVEKWVIIIAAVKPDATGKGVGGKLLHELESKVAALGGVKMFIFTNKDDDQVINFYKKNGYEDAGWIKDYQYGKDNSAVFLLKYLQ